MWVRSVRNSLLRPLIVIVPSLTFSATNGNKFLSRCDSAQKKPDVDISAFKIELDDNAEEDAKWEEDKKHCSFCMHFIESPCKREFRNWSRCVDKAKSLGPEINFVEGCKEYTLALMSCTEKHPDYFNEKEESTEEDVAASTNDSSISKDT
jgi:hypothetical protein